KDDAGNMGSDASDANFTIMRPANADTQSPTVAITAPTAGSTLQAGATVTISFRSSDNVGVTSHNIAFAGDGSNFNTSLVSGLAGNVQSFQFKVPSVSTTSGAIRVQALDAAGNVGMAVVGQLTINVDSQKPIVTVTSPKDKDKLKGGQPFTVTFTSSDDVGVVSHEIQLSQDGG